VIRPHSKVLLMCSRYSKCSLHSRSAH